MAQGRLKKVFPGGNTSQGFYSFYDYIIAADATRIFVIKGGPGVGKSTFMRKIGEAMLEKGYDVEFHCCSSDNNSMDGVVIPAIGVALLDGTAPHVVDPKNPGAVDEIVHLGDYWDEENLRRHKKEILASNREVGRLFRRAYSYLAAAKLFLDEVESYYQDTQALDTGGLDKLCLELVHEIFDGQQRQTEKPRARHLFATAITPQGPVSHLETIVGHLGKRYIISGDDGTGKTTLVARLKDAAMMRGFHVEAYHCALTPSQVEHLVIPALDVAIINSVEPHYYQPKPQDTVIDTMQFVNPVLNEHYLAEKTTAREMYRRCMELAVEYIARAKAEHDHMETYYIPAMDFTAIAARRQAILQRILGYAAEQGKAK
ncbi:MAG: PRK06851 family protein [Desulfurispora sp.]|uniref:PRK06851 family protein n=1 Tax=Desulfurispora sp. TaxID=3014275 RepID=UPI00404B3646